MALTLALVFAELAGWFDPSPVGVLAGQATCMDPGVMAIVATVRGHIADPADYPAWLAEQGVIGAVALNRAGDVGRQVWVTGPAGLEGPFLVLDCARYKHYLAREAAGRVLEVDGATAERWHMDDLVDVLVWFAESIDFRCFKNIGSLPQELPR